jgi:hypothetical protein
MSIIDELDRIDGYQDIPDMDAKCQADLAMLARILREAHAAGFVDDDGKVRKVAYTTTALDCEPDSGWLKLEACGDGAVSGHGGGWYFSPGETIVVLESSATREAAQAAASKESKARTAPRDTGEGEE